MTSVGDSSNGLLTEAALNCWLGWNLQLCVNDGVREGSPCNGGSLREVMSTYGSGWNSQEQWLKYIQRHDLEE